MHAGRIVARILGPCLVDIHAKRVQALQRAVEALLCGGVVSLSALALAMRAPTDYKHRLKSVDRLLGSAGMQSERHRLYAMLAARWLSGVAQVLLVVDWSDLTADQRWQWLRASVVVEGRSQTLYEEAHPRQRYGHPQVHRQFLRRVAELLPDGCAPIVMTDAGFHASWFKLVAARGWCFIGRLRGRDMVKRGEGEWKPIVALHRQATEIARDLGRHQYVRSNPIEARLVLSCRPYRGRHRLNMYGKPRAGRSSVKSGRAAREPWLLAASPQLDHLMPRAIVSLYAQRMQIEQSFRDTKNLRVGQGLQASRSRSRERLQMLLLIAHLAGFVQRLIGEDAKARQLELHFVAHRRTRPEISTLTLGRRILDAPAHWLARLTPWAAIPQLAMQAEHACSVT
ncbi:MAG: IS4 family transposase [Deltaproteobacteria bacterium]|nr:IS4 family transposase [Deltaproteobacteria bacterium]